MKTMIIKIIMTEMIVILIMMMMSRGQFFWPQAAVKYGFKSSIYQSYGWLECSSFL